MKERFLPYPEIQPDLPPSTRDILARAEELSGKSIRLIAAPLGIHAKATVRVTSPTQEHHTLLFDPKYREFLPHLVAHECSHILRLFGASEGERYLPAISDAEFHGAAASMAPDFDRIARTLRLPGERIEKMRIMMVNGLVLQLTNLPVDIRIERYLWENHPGLRTVQERSLRHEVALTHKVLDPLVAKLSPEVDYIASNTMNYAWCKGIAELMGDPSISAPYEGTRYPTLGDQLYRELARQSDNHRGDRATTNHGAHLLALDDWFHWSPLEQTSDDVLDFAFSMKGYRIKKLDLSQDATFNLLDDELFRQILDDLGKLNELSEDGSGIVEITSEDLEEMEVMPKDEAERHDDKAKRRTREIIAQVRAELDPKLGCATYYCY